MQWCWAMRWRVPMVRKPACWWRVALAAFSGKIEDGMVQTLSASPASMR